MNRLKVWAKFSSKYVCKGTNVLANEILLLPVPCLMENLLLLNSEMAASKGFLIITIALSKISISLL